MDLLEVVVWEIQAASEAGHELLRDMLGRMHEFGGLGFKVGQVGIGEPFAIHVLAELHLIGFFVVGGAGGGPNLGVLFPARVMGSGKGDGCFNIVWE